MELSTISLLLRLLRPSQPYGFRRSRSRGCLRMRLASKLHIGEGINDGGGPGSVVLELAMKRRLNVPKRHTAGLFFWNLTLESNERTCHRLAKRAKWLNMKNIT